ncbi:MAG: hypothetical protein SGILL_004743 [Bacillariaceae sp.]
MDVDVDDDQAISPSVVAHRITQRAKTHQKNISHSPRISNTKATKTHGKDYAKETGVKGSDLKHPSDDDEFQIVFFGHDRKHSRFEPSRAIVDPPKLSKEGKEDGEYVDFGNLSIGKTRHGQSSLTPRRIRQDPWLLQNDFRKPTTPRDDDNDMYFAFDDDLNRNEFFKEDSNPSDTQKCRRISEHRVNFPNCNMFHEAPRLEYQAKYLNEGAYRQVMVLKHSFAQHAENIILKDIQYSHDFVIGDYEFTRMDAMVAERLTASPRIYDIYGFCGQGIISEFFSHGDLESVTIPDDFKPEKNGTLEFYNDFDLEQKLMISLQMAEAIADLHGYPGGVITHQDIQLSQFLFNENATRIVLNDFNRAEFMLWDDENQDYCKYTEGRGNGDWRSPEEFYDNPLNEEVDVYSLGNNMYSIFTGLWVFYDSKDTKETQKRVKEGEKPYLDPRYKIKDPIQAQLIDIIDSCLTYNPSKRPSIFEVITALRETLGGFQSRATNSTTKA